MDQDLLISVECALSNNNNEKNLISPILSWSFPWSIGVVGSSD